MPAERTRSLSLVVVTALFAAILTTMTSAPARAAGDVRRVAGADRIATAIALSVDSFPAAAPAVVVASAGSFADALAAAPLAGAAGGPVLLNPTAALDDRVRAEVERLGADTVYLMGGPNAQSPAVYDALLALPSVNRVDRVSGASRYATAAEAAKRAVELWRDAGDASAGDHVLVALGAHPTDPSRAWPDALAAGPLAAHAHRPILLTERDRVPAETDQAVTDLGTTVATIVGGVGAIPDSTADQVGDETVEKRRIGGTNRFETAALLADRAVANGADPDRIVLATANDFPDGLAAGPAAFASDGILLLVPSDDLDRAAVTRAFLAGRVDTAQVRVAGGPKAVSEGALVQVRTVVTGSDVVAVALSPVVGGFSSALGLTSPPSSDRRFVWEQNGAISEIVGGQRAVWLDLGDRVKFGGEQGLLGLAFHPNFPTDPRAFVHYSRSGDGATQIAEVTVDGAGVAQAATLKVLLTVAQPASNHNGGNIIFGRDGMLYVGLGDGGGGNDQYGNGENTATLLGSLLRLDVSTPGAYSNPSDNPFAGGGGAPEIWAYGLRNPYRIATDTVTGELLIADVGQSAWEEIDVAAAGAAGRNYGWSTREGAHCRGGGTCATDGRTDPVLEYANDSGTCAIIGGHVYRGSAIPELRGQFLYADFCGGWVRSARLVGEALGSQHDFGGALAPGGSAMGFGQDAYGEVYVTNGQTIFKVVRA